MKVSAEMSYIGYEEGVSGNGNAYTVVGLLQGLDSQRIYISDPDIKSKIVKLQPNTPVVCKLNITLSKDRTFINLDDIIPASGGK